MRDSKKNRWMALVACAMACVVVLVVATSYQQSPQDPDASVVREEAVQRVEPKPAPAGKVFSQAQGGEAAQQADDGTQDQREVTAPDEGAPQVDDQDVQEDVSVAGDEPRTDADELPEETFVMPKNVACEPQVALVSVPEGTSADQVRQAIQTQGNSAEVEEVIPGTMRVSAVDGSIADVANELLARGVAAEAQPNYIYHIAEELAADASGAQPVPESSQPTQDLGQQPTANTEQGESEAGESVRQEPSSPGDGTTPQGNDDSQSDEASQPEGNVAEQTVEAGEPADATTGTALETQSATAGEAANGDEPVLTGASTTNDPLSKDQWELDSIHAREAWDLAKADQSVTVAVLDSGCLVSHEDLKANVVDPYNVYTGRSNVDPSNDIEINHGTHVAGTIAGVSNNGVGISGVSHNARVMPVRVANNSGTASTQTLIKGINYVLQKREQRNVRVINLSMNVAGTLSGDESLAKKISEAYDRGILTVVASGNKDASSNWKVPYYSSPGDYDKAVSVINLQQSGSDVTKSPNSNYNVSGTHYKNISAPGTSILSTYGGPGGSEYGTLTGTSMAAPVVSGVCALMFAANPSLSAHEAAEILYATATDIGSSGWDESYGFGEVNARDAVYGALHGVSADKLDYVRNLEARLEADRNRQAAKSVLYHTHVQSYGWMGWMSNGATSGTVGKSKRIEAIELLLNGAPYSGTLMYRTHVQRYGWMGWKTDGETSGTEGEGKRVEAIQIRLTGTMAQHYDVYYRVHVQKFGWSGWAKNGTAAGSAGYSYRVEGIQVVLRPKGSTAPGSTAHAFRFPVAYRAHIQGQGWQAYRRDGATAGTMGKSRRIEALKMTIAGSPYAGSIAYRAYVQGVGWQGWRQNNALAGTQGKGKRIEALAVKLTGTVSEHYDVYYRVYVQRRGWMGWAKNGGSAGTAGYSLRIEGVQVRLVPKGGSAPGRTSGAFVKR